MIEEATRGRSEVPVAKLLSQSVAVSPTSQALLGAQLCPWADSMARTSLSYLVDRIIAENDHVAALLDSASPKLSVMPLNTRATSIEGSSQFLYIPLLSRTTVRCYTTTVWTGSLPHSEDLARAESAPDVEARVTIAIQLHRSVRVIGTMRGRQWRYRRRYRRWPTFRCCDND